MKRAVVGLQARQAPLVKKIKKLVDSGTVGKVLSSTWTGQGGNLGPTVTEGYEYVASDLCSLPSHQSLDVQTNILSGILAREK